MYANIQFSGVALSERASRRVLLTLLEGNSPDRTYRNLAISTVWQSNVSLNTELPINRERKKKLAAAGEI
ncbi:hypothetical protein Taro_030200 [Colocasia esculenta]|uniref:Uncharacterized protein n=1 Tax=Colocasia esculenta TaxID=4460 RepID=A0A843VZI4_COLES|nr:hypothetical protein [Colocasia esculenta]